MGLQTNTTRDISKTGGEDGQYYDACLPFGLWESLIFGNAVLTSVRIIKSTKGDDCIGRMLVIEFNESDSEVFDKVIEVVQGSNNFETRPDGNERVIRYHLCHLRKKLNTVSPDEPFIIRCIRDVGYCFEVKSK